METILIYYSPIEKTVTTENGFTYREIKSLINGEELISFKNEIELFELFYKRNNSLRYCNGSYYKFKDINFENKYNNWLNSNDYKQKSFSLYYNNSIVD
jgi:hypothetical protein